MGDRWNEGRGSAVVRGQGEEFVRRTEPEEEKEEVEEVEEGACGPECRSAVNFGLKLLLINLTLLH